MRPKTKKKDYLFEQTHDEIERKRREGKREREMSWGRRKEARVKEEQEAEDKEKIAASLIQHMTEEA